MSPISSLAPERHERDCRHHQARQILSDRRDDDLSWLLTTDHKRIALLYLGSITLFFFVGGIAAALIRYNLIAPQGMISSAETYNRLFTTHGVVMVWFFLIPAVPELLATS